MLLWVSREALRDSLPIVLRAASAVLLGFFLLVGIARFPIPRPPYAFTPAIFRERLTSVAEDAAARSRWQLLGPLWAAVWRAPLLGSGFGSIVEYKSADPRIVRQTGGTYRTYTFEWGYLDLWLKMGLLGFGAIGLILVVLVRDLSILWQNKKYSPWGRLAFGFCLGLLTLAATHVFSPYLNHPLGFGVLLLVIAFLLMVGYEHSG
jgi:O-antigen ligase